MYNVHHLRRYRLYRWLCSCAAICLAYLFLTTTAQAIQACASPPTSFGFTLLRGGTSFGTGTSANEVCSFIGGVAVVGNPYCFIAGHAGDPNWQTSFFASPSPPTCDAGKVMVGASCFPAAYAGLSDSAKTAIAQGNYSSQAAASKACTAGIAAAQEGLSPADIKKWMEQASVVCPRGTSSITDSAGFTTCLEPKNSSGVPSTLPNSSSCPAGQFFQRVGTDTQCINADGVVMSQNGKLTADGQAAADAVAAAAAAGGAGTPAPDPASSTPPTPTLAHQAGRGWYTPAYNSFYDAIKEPLNTFKTSELGGLIASFLPNLSGGGHSGCFGFRSLLGGGTINLCIPVWLFDFVGYSMLLVAFMWGFNFVFRK